MSAQLWESDCQVTLTRFDLGTYRERTSLEQLTDSCKPWGIYYSPELSLMDFALWSPVEYPGTMKGSHSVVTVLMSHLEAGTHRE